MPDPEIAPATTQPSRVHRIFTASLIIGVPGSGKTTLFKGFSEYLWETFRKVLLLYSWDGGAIPTDVQKRMKQGLIRYWRARTRSAPGLGLETMYLASKGYWPRFIDAETGETSPAVQLVPPVTVKYVVTCPKGHPLSTVPAISLVSPMFCTPCGQFIGQPDLRVTEEATRTKGFEAVGGVGFDGLTSMGDVVLDHMDLQRGEGLIGGEKSAFGGVVISGTHKFGGNNRADVGFGQTRAHQFVNNSLAIPYLVEGPVFTALAMEATDEGGLPIVGAKLPGRAATDEASAWFGNVAETAKTPDDQGRPCFTLYLRPFVDPQGRRHLLKTSASPTGVPEKLVDPAEVLQQPYTVVNLGNVFRMLDEDLRRSLLEDLPGAPGIPPGLTEYGEAATIETLPAAPVAGPMIMQPIPRQPAPAAPVTPTTQAGTLALGGASAPAPVAPGPAAAPPAAAPPPPKMGAAGAASTPTGTTGPALMVARPRVRRGAAVAQTMPMPTAEAPAPAVEPAPVAVQTAPLAAPAAMQPAVVPTGLAPVTTATAAATTAAPSGSAPPPPGMRPPARVPGS